MKNLSKTFKFIFPLIILIGFNVGARFATKDPDSINSLDKLKIHNLEERSLEKNSRTMLADIAQTFAQKSGTTSQVRISSIVCVAKKNRVESFGTLSNVYKNQ